MQKNPVSWWEIGTKDAGALADFLKKAFEWDIKFDEKMDYHTISAGEARNGFYGGGLFGLKEECKDHPYLTLYIAVDDVDAKAKQIKELGGTIVQEPFDVEGVGRICMFKEPQGQLLGLIKELKQA